MCIRDRLMPCSHGGGGASNVDAPGSDFKLYWERTFSLVLESIMLKLSPILFALVRTPGKKRPDNVGAVVVVRLVAIYGGSVAVLRC